MSTTDRGALEEERRFLTDALRRLGEEEASASISTEEANALRDSYTVRLATVLRTLDAPVAAATPKVKAKAKKRPATRVNKKVQRAGWAAVIVAFAGVAMLSLFTGSDNRLAGETSTGSVEQTPSQLLGLASQQTSAGKPADAVKTYDKVLAVEPGNVQALAYRGWLVRLAGLPDEGARTIDRAIELQPTYPDARFFKGYILLRDKNDPAGALQQFEAFMTNNPPQEMVPLVQSAMEDAKALVAASGTTVPANG